MKKGTKVVVGSVVVAAILCIALGVLLRHKPQTTVEIRATAELTDSTPSPSAPRRTESRFVATKASVTVADPAIPPTLIATLQKEAAAVTSGTEHAEVPIWAITVPVVAGNHTYGIIKDAKRVNDPLNKNPQSYLGEDTLAYPAPPTQTYPRVLAGDRVQFVYAGRIKARLFLVASWRGSWWSCDEFKPMNAAAEANMRDILADKTLGTLRGTVIDSARRPVAKALVRVVIGFDAQASAQCDNNGRFCVDRLFAAPEMGVSAHAWGFTDSPWTKSKVLAGDKNEPLVLQITPTGIVMGQVIDEFGKPVVNANIAATTTSENSFFAPLAPTDSAGRYTHANLKPGTYDLTVRTMEYAPVSRLGVVIQAGIKPLQMDFQVNSGATITGKVVQEVAGKDEPVADADVTYQCASVDASGTPSNSEWIRVAAKTQADGTFAVQHAPYKAQLSGWATKGDNRSQSNNQFTIARGTKPDPQTLRLDATSRIAGRVVDTDKKPVPSADLILLQSQSRTRGYSIPDDAKKAKKATTDEKGNFEIASLPATSQHVFRVEAKGFAPTITDPIAGDAKDPVEIVMKRGGIIAGHVLDGGTKSPLSGVMVRAVSIGNRNNLVYPSGQTKPVEATTGEDGSFELPNLAEGNYAVGGNRTTADAIVCVVPKTGVKVQDNQRTDSIELLAHPAATVSGTVLSAESRQPIDKAQVMATLSDMQNSGLWFDILTQLSAGSQTTTDAQGKFSATALAPGKYTVRANKQGLLDDNANYSMFASSQSATPSSKPKTSSKEITIEPGQNLEGIELLLSEGGSLTGVVLDAGDRPVSQTQVTADIKRDPVFGGYFNSYQFRQTTDAAGRFRITGLPLNKGECRAITSPYEGQSGSKAIPFSASEYVKLTTEKPTAEVTLRVARAGSIAGTVKDPSGSPLSSVQLTASLLGQSGMMGYSRGAMTDPSGHYKFEGLSAGEYQISLTKDKYERKTADKFVLKDGQNAEGVDFVLTVGKTLTGVLVDLNSKKLANWNVSAAPVASNNSRSWTVGATTASDGRFKIEGIGQGKVVLSVSYNSSQFGGTANGYRYCTFQSGEVDPSDQEQIFILPFGGTLQGRVLFADTKAPASDARLAVFASGDPSQPKPEGTQCMLQNFNVSNTPVTQADGSFRITDLPIGKYSVNIQSKQASQRQIENVFIDTTLLTDLKDILLSRGVTVTGRLIEAATGKPYTPDQSNIRSRVMALALRPGNERAGNERAGIPLSLEDGGTFTLTSVPADATALVIIAMGFLPVRIEPIQLTVGSPTNLGDLRLNAGETVKGKISGPKGEPAKAAQVVVMCKIGGTDMPSGLGVSDDKGEFSIAGCTAGPATLQAYAQQQQGNPWITDMQHPAILRNYAFTVLPGGKTYVQVQFPPQNTPTPTPAGK